MAAPYAQDWGARNDDFNAARFNSVPQQQRGQSGKPIPGMAKLGTQIAADGTITVRSLVPDMELSFEACRDTVRLLAALYRDWSYPALISGRAYSPGATYKVENYEQRKLEDLDSAEKTEQIRRIKHIVIKEVVDEPQFKIIQFEVDSRIQSDFFSEPFPPVTYITIEIGRYPYGEDQTLITLTMDGGPPDVETTYCCLCIANPGTLQQQQESQENRPKVYKQANNFTEYVKNYDPNTSLAQQVSSVHTPVHRKLSGTSSNTIRTHNTTGSGGQRTQYSGPGGNNNNMPMGMTQYSGSSTNLGRPQSPYGRPVPAPPQGMGMSPPSPMNGGMGYSPAVSATPGRAQVPMGSPPRPPGAGPQGQQIPAGGGHADEIRKLFELYNIGALTKEEYEIEKKKIVNQRHTPAF